MEVLVERGASKGDCVQKIVQKYGIWFNILREKKFRTSGPFGLFAREGVEVEFCLSSNRAMASQGLPLQGAPLAAAPLQIAGEPAPPYFAGKPPPAAPKNAASYGGDTTLDFVEAKKRVLAVAGKDYNQVFQQIQEQDDREAAKQQQILDELKEIKDKINSVPSPRAADHPHLVRISELLRQNDFSGPYSAGLLERARKELPLEILENFDAVQDRFLEWIGESIRIYRPPENPRRGRIMVLVGPTGVGKTTTIAKLAAIYGIENSGHRALSVRMITIDAFRIGAGEQIEAFGDIMEIPVSYVDNRRELRKEIDLYREETDLILVDTIGRSPRDSAKLGEMKDLLDACGSRAEIHLVLSASTKTSDIEHILRQFEPFNYQAVLLTKLDETRHVGNVISALAEKEKPVSYISDGQIVPKDIKKASVIQFLINLDDFRVDREKIENRFPADEADQFQWG